jgi:hypothetical protein
MDLRMRRALAMCIAAEAENLTYSEDVIFFT